MKGPIAAGCLLVLAVSAYACGDATDQIQGGLPRFDPAQVGDGGITNGCDPAGDGGAAGTGTTWPDLYRDYFGPAGRANCNGDGKCHGGATESGAKRSEFICGTDADSCYAGITNPPAGLLIPGDAKQMADPTTAGLWLVLRKRCIGGNMPKRSTFAFATADLDRLKAWIAAGATKN
jgi:hypothetical protein